MAKALNPGGIKYRGSGKPYKAMDDCYVNGKKVKCSFQTFKTYQSMIDGWSDVLNLPRYKKCKNFMYAKTSRGLTPKQKVDGTCKCLQKQGYHTAKQWKVRSDLSSSYWTAKKSFPIDYF
jgi:flagellum-specific peptidoglycan hydrolase FlgJ